MSVAVTMNKIEDSFLKKKFPERIDQLDLSCNRAQKQESGGL
jgi:hypothetical protein